MNWTHLAIFQENVLGLHVPMEDLPLVQVEEGERHLNEPVEYLVLAEVLPLGRLDLAVDVAAVAVDHDDV